MGWTTLKQFPLAWCVWSSNRNKRIVFWHGPFFVSSQQYSAPSQPHIFSTMWVVCLCTVAVLLFLAYFILFENREITFCIKRRFRIGSVTFSPLNYYFYFTTTLIRCRIFYYKTLPSEKPYDAAIDIVYHSGNDDTFSYHCCVGRKTICASVI